MKVVRLAPDDIVASEDLRRSGSTKQFEERMKASIAEIGLVEPLKVARPPSGGHVLVDGNLRLKAIREIRREQPERFETVLAYVVDFDKRYEIRFQTDIYQDLLPSQLASLVEHLHRVERIKKADIARYIGVSTATLRNYTGLWRLVQRGGLFSSIVDLMDAGVIPSSNPYAWLRLTESGLEKVLLDQFCDDETSLPNWIESRIALAQRGAIMRYTTEFVESSTGGLQDGFYRNDEDLRSVKKDLGLRRAINASGGRDEDEGSMNDPESLARLRKVTDYSREPVLATSAAALMEFLA